MGGGGEAEETSLSKFYFFGKTGGFIFTEQATLTERAWPITHIYLPLHISERFISRLSQSAMAVITKCDSFIIKCDRYSLVPRRSLFLSSERDVHVRAWEQVCVPASSRSVSFGDVKKFRAKSVSRKGTPGY